MSLLICEAVTAGALGHAVPPGLLAEAEAMLAALVRDFSAIADLHVTVLRAPGLAPLPALGGAARIRLQVQPWSLSGFVAAAREAGQLLLVAPEQDQLAAQLAQAAQAAGVQLLGCAPETLALCSDKRATARQLARHAVPQPPTWAWADATPAGWARLDGIPAVAPETLAPLADDAGGWVLKPVDGCGCDQVMRYRRLADALAMHAAATDRSAWLLQAWVEGAPASLSLLGTADGLQLLTVNRQRLEHSALPMADAPVTGQAVQLQAVEVDALAPCRPLVQPVVAGLAAALPGLRGIVGADVVLGASGAWLVEVNPRVTLAYPALAHAVACNPAAAWLDAVAPVPATGRSGAPAVILGWDIGGAHLKVAVLALDGHLLAVEQRPCALWRGLDQLAPLVQDVVRQWPGVHAHALTMSGEMVDLFPDRATGVRRLLELLQDLVQPVPLTIYAGERGLVATAEACRDPGPVASANWHATASWVAHCQPDCLLVDVGSTTSDLLVIQGGVPRPLGRTDAARLASGELVYTGLVRTPLMALARTVPFRGQVTGVMAEWFATTADVHRVLGTLDEADDQHPAADNGPKTVSGSLVRLARMVGCDAADHAPDDWQALARTFRDLQRAELGAALDRCLARLASAGPVPVVLAGAGAPLVTPLLDARQLAARPFGQLGALAPTPALQHAASRAAPAVAVAALARKQGRGQNPAEDCPPALLERDRSGRS